MGERAASQGEQMLRTDDDGFCHPRIFEIDHHWHCAAGIGAKSNASGRALCYRGRGKPESWPAKRQSRDIKRRVADQQLETGESRAARVVCAAAGGWERAWGVQNPPPEQLLELRALAFAAGGGGLTIEEGTVLVSRSKTATAESCSQQSRELLFVCVCVCPGDATDGVHPRSYYSRPPPSIPHGLGGAGAAGRGAPLRAPVHAAAASEPALAQAKVKPEAAALIGLVCQRIEKRAANRPSFCNGAPGSVCVWPLLSAAGDGGRERACDCDGIAGEAMDERRATHYYKLIQAYRTHTHHQRKQPAQGSGPPDLSGCGGRDRRISRCSPQAAQTITAGPGADATNWGSQAASPGVCVCGVWCVGVGMGVCGCPCSDVDVASTACCWAD